MLLKVAGWLVFAAALLHVGIIVVADWYRFFGGWLSQKVLVVV